MHYDVIGNEEENFLVVELAQEKRNEAQRRRVEYQRKMRLAFDKRVATKYFHYGDLVLRRMEATGKKSRQIGSEMGRTISGRARIWGNCLQTRDHRGRSYSSSMEYGTSPSFLCFIHIILSFDDKFIWCNDCDIGKP
jgi:hypothetical protein